MPVSHVGLTVSHLPSSCSFYLAALSPLGYKYLGQEGNSIAFGRTNAEFYISKETDSLKATAAHIAFDAPSRDAVDAFFIAALKADGRIHGEPTVRDLETGYYSAAVLDLDGNSIEAMHREREKASPAKTESIADEKRVLDWQKEVAKSTVGRGSEASKNTNTTRIIVNNVTAPANVVSRSTASIRDDGETSAKALIGTLLGAAAGAAVAYAMTKGDADSLKSPITQTITYQTVDAQESQRDRSTVSSKRSSRPATTSHVSHHTVRQIDYPQAPMSGSGQSVISHRSYRPKYLEGPKASSAQNLASTLIDSFIPPSEVARFPPHAIARSHTDSILERSVAMQKSDLISQHSKSSCASSSARTVTPNDRPTIPRSSTGTDARSARDVPLPHSTAGSSTSRQYESAEELIPGLRSGLGSVAPSDSVSQAGSRKSKTSKKSSRHGHSRSGRAEDLDNNSQASQQTVRYRGSHSGKSLQMPSASKPSVSRSVKSFLHGM